MSIAKVIEISAGSTESFQDAVDKGIARAHETVKNVQAAWVKEQQVEVSGGKVTNYRVNLKVTFLLE